ncbi:MAG TPA: hypothetical protein VMX17_06015 [Candidatus Glassbacteria bacterium]|nr:hypothetical protein [Candidatus Glassbacteria bacterium]
MIGDTKEELEARIHELKHIKVFIEVLIKAREEELKEVIKNE